MVAIPLVEIHPQLDHRQPYQCVRPHVSSSELICDWATMSGRSNNRRTTSPESKIPDPPCANQVLQSPTALPRYHDLAGSRWLRRRYNEGPIKKVLSSRITYHFFLGIFLRSTATNGWRGFPPMKLPSKRPTPTQIFVQAHSPCPHRQSLWLLGESATSRSGDGLVATDQLWSPSSN